MRGAEAVLSKTTIIGIPAVKKDRIPKTYREQDLDKVLRKSRTKVEARLLHKAKLTGVDCPTVLEISDFSLGISFIGGGRPEMNVINSKKTGELLAKLHSADIIHGDFTPANLLMEGKKLYVIDFGLGFFSSDIEDKAIDVYTMLKSIREKKAKEAFLQAYENYKKSKQVFKRLRIIEKRVRYAF